MESSDTKESKCLKEQARKGLSKKDKAYLSVATYLATKSTARMKHGALLVKGGRVIGMGHNKAVNHPMIVSSHHIKSHCSRHAEAEAIRDAGSNVKGSIIYIARVNKSGQVRNSAPCSRCQKMIDELGIKRVVWTE